MKRWSLRSFQSVFSVAPALPSAARKRYLRPAATAFAPWHGAASSAMCRCSRWARTRRDSLDLSVSRKWSTQRVIGDPLQIGSRCNCAPKPGRSWLLRARMPHRICPPRWSERDFRSEFVRRTKLSKLRHYLRRPARLCGRKCSMQHSFFHPAALTCWRAGCMRHNSRRPAAGSLHAASAKQLRTRSMGSGSAKFVSLRGRIRQH